eukprot:gnl/MRDRNA2_/MRDRNA2_87706_c0_seq1.p1 gnl/MRDRNA2_/MRDRNA2_87706_c0~~gnl/MRDRNA2_/MRDRNA2_87706_c0_seq1.p1  ORF type:complete len:179 (+),score=19.52 gnl/MRDRNA2_/MRDRNA2_87706_c0_seq1:92-628(+)
MLKSVHPRCEWIWLLLSSVAVAMVLGGVASIVVGMLKIDASNKKIAGTCVAQGSFTCENYSCGKSCTKKRPEFGDGASFNGEANRCVSYYGEGSKNEGEDCDKHGKAMQSESSCVRYQDNNECYTEAGDRRGQEGLNLVITGTILIVLGLILTCNTYRWFRKHVEKESSAVSAESSTV